MKKLLILASLAVMTLISCQKVEPTKINYNYTATVQGTVYYANGTAVGSNWEVTIHVLEAKDKEGNKTLKDYVVLTNNSGVYSLTLPCKTSNGITIDSVTGPDYKNDGNTYVGAAAGKNIENGKTETIDLTYVKQ